MKRIISLLVVVLTLSLLLTIAPFSHAEDITRTTLKNTCSTLETYMVDDVYQNSDGYKNYQDALKDAKDVVANNSATTAAVENAFDKLREAYLVLMRNTYDYSGLEALIAIADDLDPTLYEEESFSAFQAALKDGLSEYSSPRLFAMNDQTVSEYIAYMQGNIDELEETAALAYNALVLLPLPEEVSVGQLSSIVSAVEFSLRNSAAKSFRGWTDVRSALEDTKDVLEERNPKDDEIREAYTELTKAYETVLEENFDFKQAKDSLQEATSLSSATYARHSWENYEQERKKLETALSQPIFFCVSVRVPDQDFAQAVQNIFNQLDADLKAAAEQLIPMEKVDALSALCQKYKTVSHTNKLDVYEKKLTQAVEGATALLEKEDFTAEDLEKATAAVEGAAEQLKKATDSLNRQQNADLVDHKKEIRIILVFTALSFLLSLAFAVFFSIRQTGEMDWTR